MSGTRKVQFQIADLFPASEPLAVFVVATSTSHRDLLFINRLLTDAVDGIEESDRMYLLRVSIGHLHELSQTLRQGRGEDQVRGFLDSLSKKQKKDLDLTVCVEDGDWVENAIVYIRNQAFHYGTQRNLKAISWALREFKNENVSSSVEIGPTMNDASLPFVDLISLQHFIKFPGNLDENERISELFKAVATRTTAALRVTTAILESYLIQKKEQWTLV